MSYHEVGIYVSRQTVDDLQIIEMGFLIFMKVRLYFIKKNLFYTTNRDLLQDASRILNVLKKIIGALLKALSQASLGSVEARSVNKVIAGADRVINLYPPGNIK